MQIEKIQGGLGGGQKPYPVNFGIRIDKRIMPSFIDNIGLLDNGQRLDIYTSYSKDKSIKYKLYYLSDRAGKWIKSKLKCFDSDNKLFKVIRSSANETKNYSYQA